MGESRASVPAGGAYIPRNVIVSHPAIQGSLDIRWDDSSHIDPTIVGYNVYRSQVELVDTFRRINREMVQTNFYRDSLRDDAVVEDVSDQFVRTSEYHGDPDDRFDLIGIDKSRWAIFDPDEVLSQQTILRFRDGFVLNRLAYLESRFMLEGDFDVEVAYKVRRLDEPASGTAGGFLWVITAAGGSSIRFIRRRTPTGPDPDSGDGLAVESVATDGTVTTLAFRPASDLALAADAGRLRIVRTSENLTFAYDDGDEMVLLHTEMGVGDALVKVRVGGVSGEDNADITTDSFFEFRRWTVLESTVVKAWVSIDPNMWLRGGEQSPPDQLVADSAFVIRLANPPVVDNRGQNRPTDDPAFIKVTVDGREAEVTVLNGIQGRVAVASFPVYDDILKRFIDRPLPRFGSVVKVEYKTNTNVADSSLDKKLFYRVTAVCRDDDGNQQETGLSKTPATRLGGDGLTYYWEESIRRNKWILEQGGHRSELYVAKKVGEKCPQCEPTAHTHDNPSQSCPLCFGTGFLGGYEGPFDIIISPPFAETKVEHSERGMRFIKQPEVWMTATPLVSQRDFMLLRDGKCYAVGPITHVEVRNHTVLQQHFSISALDTGDARYRFVRGEVFSGELPTPAGETLKGSTQHPLGKEIRQDGTSRKHSIRKTPGDTTFENHLY